MNRRDTEPCVRWCGRTAEANPSAFYPMAAQAWLRTSCPAEKLAVFPNPVLRQQVVYSNVLTTNLERSF